MSGGEGTSESSQVSGAGGARVPRTPNLPAADQGRMRFARGGGAGGTQVPAAAAGKNRRLLLPLGRHQSAAPPDETADAEIRLQGDLLHDHHL